jgi:hypothetical protein
MLHFRAKCEDGYVHRTVASSVMDAMRIFTTITNSSIWTIADSLEVLMLGQWRDFSAAMEDVS